MTKLFLFEINEFFKFIERMQRLQREIINYLLAVGVRAGKHFTQVTHGFIELIHRGIGTGQLIVRVTVFRIGFQRLKAQVGRPLWLTQFEYGISLVT